MAQYTAAMPWTVKRGEWQAEFDARMREIQTEAEKRLAEARQSWQRETSDNLARARESWDGELAGHLASEHRAASETAQKIEQALRAELGVAQSAVAERDAALANMEQVWKAKEAESLKAMESRLTTEARQTIADLNARCARAETALARAQQEAGESARRESDRLREELVSAQAIIAERDAALLEARAAQTDNAGTELRRREAELAAAQASMAELQSRTTNAERAMAKAKESWVQESEKALGDTKAEWAKSEAKKISDAESRALAKSAAVLAETQNRLQEAEQAIAQLRLIPPPMPDASLREENHEIEELRAQLLDLQAELAKREVEIGRMRQSALQNGLQSTEDNAAPERRRSREKAADSVEAQLKRSRHIAFDLALLFGVIALIVTFYPYIENFLPDSWSRGLGSATASISAPLNSLFQPPAAPASPAAAPRIPVAAALPMADLTHAANLRSGPGVGSAAMATLQSNAKVAVVQQKGNWSLVRVQDAGGKSRQGWIYSSFLKSPKEKISAPRKRAR